MAEAPEPRKRSRFDVGPSDSAEPPARRSRFDVGGDRRSRSPGTPNADRATDRERTPLSASAKGAKSPSASAQSKDAAARAAEAAAKINAQLQQKKAVQQVDVPPIRQVSRLNIHTPPQFPY